MSISVSQWGIIDGRSLDTIILMTLSRRILFACYAMSLHCLTCVPARAEDSALERTQAVIDALGASPADYISIIFDVSGSMKTRGVLQKARQATLKIVKKSALVGAYVRIVGADAKEHVLFDKVIRSNADRSAAIDAVPFKVLEGAGTNLRRPHDTTLQQALAQGYRRPVTVFVTDSYNDQPTLGSVEMDLYTDYYHKSNDLSRIADTQAGLAYQKRLDRYGRVGGRTFGIGIDIDPVTQRPIERSPKDIATPAGVSPPSVARSGTGEPIDPDPIWPYLAGLVAIVISVATAFYLRSRRPLSFRISTGGKTGHDVTFSHRDRIGLGGVVAGSTRTIPISGCKSGIAVLYMQRGTVYMSTKGFDSGRVVSINGLDVVAGNDVGVGIGDTIRVRTTVAETSENLDLRWKIVPVSWEQGAHDK